MKTSKMTQVLGCCMNQKTIRMGLATVVMVTTLLAAPAKSHAIFHWLSRCCGSNTTPTYGAAPLYSAAPAAADPCCAPPQVTQTASYVPQTCYRTQYVNVPVTTYRPVVSRDPCSGCPVTCLRPTTSYVQQAQLVPYTTYRRVLSNPCCGAAAPVVSAGYAPTYSAGVSYAAGGSCSGCSATAPMTYAPSNSAPYYGATSSSTIVSPSNGYSSSNAFTNGAPTLAPPPGGTPTYQQQKPIPKVEVEKPVDKESDEAADAGTASGTGAILSPRLFQPNDRTTSYPILRARIHRPVSYNEPTEQASPASRPAVDDGGWRPSTR
jgi:hypothetical protein